MIADPASPRLFAIVGATGTGKSSLALDLAAVLHERGTAAEIVNADAMQLYRGMNIGTAKLPHGERRDIAHHLLDVRDVTEEAAVAWYQSAAREAIDGIMSRGSHAIVVGGSGLYVSSVLYDFQFPPRDEQLRASLDAELQRVGPGVLFERLRSLDPATAERVDPRNGRRITRALEVLAQGKATHGAALPAEPAPWRPATIVGLTTPRPELIQRLDARVERMWAEGLLDEVEVLRGEGLERGVTARRAIGYAQALGQLSGELTQEQAIAETQALTRRYARRQVSWFTRYSGVRWAVGGEADASALARPDHQERVARP